MEEDLINRDILCFFLGEILRVEGRLGLADVAIRHHHRTIGIFTCERLHDRRPARCRQGPRVAVDESVEEMDERVEGEIGLGRHLITSEKSVGKQNHGRMEVGEKGKDLPETGLVGVAMLRVSLSPIVPACIQRGCGARLAFDHGLSSRVDSVGGVVVVIIRDIAEDFDIIVIGILWLADQASEIWESAFELADKVESTAYKSWLVEEDDLEKSLYKGLDSLGVCIDLEGSEEQVEVHRLL